MNPFEFVYLRWSMKVMGIRVRTLGVKWRAYVTGNVHGIWIYLHPVWWNLGNRNVSLGDRV